MLPTRGTSSSVTTESARDMSRRLYVSSLTTVVEHTLTRAGSDGYMEYVRGEIHNARHHCSDYISDALFFFCVLKVHYTRE